VTTLLEIVGDDIASLDDDDLRELIGLLCEADYRSAGLSTKGITWGGHQDAKDGGLDVVVRDSVSPPASSSVPRSTTGFQVKKPNMPRAEILKEMRPKDELRPSIKALIEEKGAYVIVSSNGSVTDTALKNRINAMNEAVENEDDYEELHLDFLDRGRIATWVRSHPTLILWVRNKIGKPLVGWRSYENWSNSPGGLDEEYLLDEGLRLHDCESSNDEARPVGDGLSQIRTALATPGKSIRLAGLSGVGKTRFAQALFDERIGDRPLNSSQVIYADMSDGPEPDPVTLANQLVNDQSSAVLIVDNCPPDLHRRLTQTCSRPHSTVSLLTVEYDVRDDIPEERTSVFRLEPASDDLIEKLVFGRFPHIGQVDARSIAEFSGGNARVAIALANTVHQGETLSGFRNEQLFERLFWQRHDPNESLLLSAQACALVYSFEGTDTTSEGSELKFLGSLIQKSGQEIYKDVAALKGRDLVQSRDVWRAILPHAIANRLAKQALEAIPKDALVLGFLENSSERLIKSFTRRLSYLHDSDVAISIVEEWLESDGWIGKSIEDLNEFGVAILKNIAPVSPEATLKAIERAANGSDGDVFTSRKNKHHSMFVRLLRHLAYDSELFQRAVNLVCRFAATEDLHEKNNSIRDVLNSLFHIHLSGTHATVESRAAVIQEMLDSGDPIYQDIGLQLLDSALEAWHFSASNEFAFGAWPRDFGSYPKTREDVVHWFSAFMEICTNIALSSDDISLRAKKLLANNLRGLWTKGRMHEEIALAVDRLLAQGAWNDGWIAVRGIIRYDSKRLDEETRKKLFALEKRLKPEGLLEKARTFALSDQRGSFDLEDDFDDKESASAGHRRAEEATRAIGIELAGDSAVFKELLPEFVSTNNTRLFSLGQGLAEGCTDKARMFIDLRDALEETPNDKRQIGVLLGFLSITSEADSALYNEILDEAVGDDLLGEWFAILQTTAAIDQRGVERLHEALDLGKTPIHSLNQLAWGRVHESIGDDDLALLLEKMLTKEGGLGVVLEILNMRFHQGKEEAREYSDALIAIARRALTMQSFDKKQRQGGGEDYALAAIAKRCLVQPEASTSARELAKNLSDAIFAHQAYSFDCIGLLNALAKMWPRIFLNEFLGRKDAEEFQRHRMFSDDFERRENPMSQIPDEEVIAWCEGDPASRYVIAASAVEGFEVSSDTGKIVWRPIVEAVLEKAPDLDKVFEELGRSLSPSSWSGSRAAILEERSALLLDLCEHDNAEVAAWANSHYERLKQAIVSEREQEEKYDRQRNESFE